MEEHDEIQVVSNQDAKHDNCKEGTQKSEHIIEERTMDYKEINNENEITRSPKKDQVLEKREEEKEGISEEIENQTESQKQSQAISSMYKQTSKASHSNKPRHTVPQPFSLATDKRMSRERRPSAKQLPQQNLSKSLSLKFHTQTSLRSEFKTGSTPSKSTLRSIDGVEKITAPGDKMKEKIKSKGGETQAKAKEEESYIKNLRKSSTFKASPLPSFYHQKSPPPKPELKKMPLTRPKSPLLGQRNKSSSENHHEKNKSEATSKGTSRTLSSTAKETIHRLFRGSLKAPSIPRKDSVKGSIPSGGRVRKEGVVSAS